MLAILMVALNWVVADPLLGCPTCKDSLHNGAAFGYAVSILFMMGMPFVILSFWVVTIVRLRRQIVANRSEKPDAIDWSSTTGQSVS